MDPGTRGAPRKALGTAAVLGAVGAGVGAYVGSLAGAMRGMDPRRQNVAQPHGVEKTGEGRPAGVLLAVNTTGERAREIASLLVEAGGREVERAHGRWINGQWEDFDPPEAPVPQDASSRP